MIRKVFRHHQNNQKRKSKERQYIMAKRKRTNKDTQNSTQKTKY